MIRTPVREEENEVSQDVVESKDSGEELTSDEVLDVKGKLTARRSTHVGERSHHGLPGFFCLFSFFSVPHVYLSKP